MKNFKAVVYIFFVCVKNVIERGILENAVEKQIVWKESSNAQLNFNCI